MGSDGQTDESVVQNMGMEAAGALLLGADNGLQLGIGQLQIVVDDGVLVMIHLADFAPGIVQPTLDLHRVVGIAGMQTYAQILKAGGRMKTLT